MDLVLDVSERGGIAVLAIKGEIDVATAPPLRDKLLALVNDGSERVIVDLSNVDFLDSTGLGVLVSVMKRLRTTGGDLRLICTKTHLLKVFEITGLTSVFEIFDTLDAAIET